MRDRCKVRLLAEGQPTRGGKNATCKSSLRGQNSALNPSFSRKANVTDAWGKAWNTCGGTRLRRGFVLSACKRARPQHLRKELEHWSKARGTTPMKGTRRPLPWPLAWRRASASRSAACFCRTATRWLSRQQSRQYTARQPELPRTTGVLSFLLVRRTQRGLTWRLGLCFDPPLKERPSSRWHPWQGRGEAQSQVARLQRG